MYVAPLSFHSFSPLLMIAVTLQKCLVWSVQDKQDIWTEETTKRVEKNANGSGKS